MKDLLGREVLVGNYICYALTAGRSANLAVYQVKEVLPKLIRAVDIMEDYDDYYEIVRESPSIFILDGFSPELFDKDICND